MSDRLAAAQAALNAGQPAEAIDHLGACGVPVLITMHSLVPGPGPVRTALRATLSQMPSAVRWTMACRGEVSEGIDHGTPRSGPVSSMTRVSASRN